jgi:acetyl esterase/lipase
MIRRLALIAALLLLASCKASWLMVANASTVLSHVDRHVDLVYGSDPRQRLDVYTPPHASMRPVVIFWYGGSWVVGSKKQYRFVGTTLAEQGFVAVIPDYRLYPQVTFPAFDEDGARAVAWVEQHVEALGGDPRHIVLMGHSAGGHTAAFLAYNHAFMKRFGADPRCIAGMIGLSGTYVLEPEPGTERATFPPPYTEADWQPIRFVDSAAPPTLLLHGADDREVLPSEAIQLRDALLGQHVRVELHIYPHRGHGETVASFASGARWRTPALQQASAFIESVARAPTDPTSLPAAAASGSP